MTNNVESESRRNLMKCGLLAGLGGLALAGMAGNAAAQAAPTSLLRQVLDRGKLIVGTGSTNAPWHFENDQGELVGAAIAFA